MSGAFLFAVIGFALVVMAIANIGCCGSGNACSINRKENLKNENTYEELAGKK
jgi:hypothetical protein